MGDDIGSGSVKGCRLRSLGNHRQQTEQHYDVIISLGCTKMFCIGHNEKFQERKVVFGLIWTFRRTEHKYFQKCHMECWGCLSTLIQGYASLLES